MTVSVAWEIKGTEFANCNCAYGCGCQFNALPDKGFCEAVAGYQVHQGNFGDVRLDGLRAAVMWRWPGAVHEGNGVMQIVIDERADARQRNALAQILSGQETQDMATVWWVFSAMCPTKHDPLYCPIDFEVDVDARRARLEIPGLVRSVGEPIRNPVTGAEHRVRIDFPQSFEFRLSDCTGSDQHVRSVRAYPSEPQRPAELRAATTAQHGATTELWLSFGSFGVVGDLAGDRTGLPLHLRSEN